MSTIQAYPLNDKDFRGTKYSPTVLYQQAVHKIDSRIISFSVVYNMFVFVHFF